MARSFFTAANTSPQALVATTPKTVLQIIAPTNQRVAVQQISISFDGIVNTNTPVKCQLYRQTSAGTSSAGNIKAKDNDITTTIQTTALDTFSAEPTSTDQLWTMYIHPQTGIIYPLPIPGEIILKGGTRLGLICTAQQAVNALAAIEGEE